MSRDVNTITPDEVLDAWIKTGGSDNGNVLYLDLGANTPVVVWGGYPTLERALEVAHERFNIEPEIDPYWIG